MIGAVLLEQLLGLRNRSGGGGFFSESKEAVFGGCFGLLMSTAFFFFFYTGLLALIFRVTYQGYMLTGATVPLILVLGASGVVSPFIGVMFGLQGGRYSATQHFGCTVLFLAGILAAIGAVVVFL